MSVTVAKVELAEILPLRALYLEEMNCQIRYNACHERGWTDSYALMLDGAPVGYGSIKGREIKDRDTVFEYFVIQPWRNRASQLFRQLLSTSGVQCIECQSNDRLLSSMLFECSSTVSADVVLFEDHAVTEHRVPGAVVRKKRAGDAIFEHKAEPAGDYVLEFGGEAVATGGFMLHYNKPFADLYMEVREDYRRRGLGSFLLQEVKKACYIAGRVPAARTGLRNAASRATLIKAGLRVSGFMLSGPADRILT
ncbi:MAG TPA: GNAT family N-acetyltransferase [Terracidiphilus sp.]|jgi:GNAT superfamily N-acetyltransferase|nr:GNAT family N-acetyltransferase [Terracidiphilus sp.]